MGSLSKLSTDDLDVVDKTDYICSICSSEYYQPRVLSCLHSFCQDCIVHIAQPTNTVQTGFVIVCPACRQKSFMFGHAAVMSLPLDTVLMSAIEEAKQKNAGNPSQASTMLRGLLLQEYAAGGDTGELAASQSFPLNQSAYETANGVNPNYGSDEEDGKDGLRNLLTCAKSAVDQCMDFDQDITLSIFGLRDQKDQVIAEVTVAADEYVKIVENWRDVFMVDAAKACEERENDLLEQHEKVSNTIERLRSAAVFIKRLVEHGKRHEVEIFRKQIEAQLANLADDLPDPRLDYSMTFQYDFNSFATDAEKYFGKLILDRDASTSTPSQSVDNIRNLLVPPMNPGLRSRGLVLPPFDTPVSGRSPGFQEVADECNGAGGDTAPDGRFSVERARQMPTPEHLVGFPRNLSNNTGPKRIIMLNRAMHFPRYNREMTPTERMHRERQLAEARERERQILRLREQDRAMGRIKYVSLHRKFGTKGQDVGYLNNPHGFCLADNENILIADTHNHRIQKFDKNGRGRFIFGIAGREDGHLWYPRKVAVTSDCSTVIVCDRGNERSRIQLFTNRGYFLRKLNVRYINIIAGAVVNDKNEIVIADSVSPSIYTVALNGRLIRWFECNEHLLEPSDLAVRGDRIYVTDYKGHTVTVFSEFGEILTRMGLDGLTTFPNGIDIAPNGEVLVGDSHGNRFHIVVFSSNGSIIGEYECPQVRVSRCCGLRILRDGKIITLAKNNHYTLVVNGPSCIQ